MCFFTSLSLAPFYPHLIRTNSKIIPFAIITFVNNILFSIWNFNFEHCVNLSSSSFLLDIPMSYSM